MNSKYTSNLGAFALFLLLAMAVTWPLILAPGQQIIASSFVYSHVWIWDLLTGYLLSDGTLLRSTDLLNFPEGGPISVIGWHFAIPLLLFRKLGIGLMFGVNLLVIFYLALGGFGAFALARRLLGKWPEAMVGGIAFGFNPFVISLVWNGQYGKLCHGFLPLLLLLLLESARSRRSRVILLYGLLFAVCLSSAPYFGIAAAVLSVVVALTACIKRRDRFKHYLVRYGLCALSAAAFSLPFLYYYFSAPSSGQGLLIPAGQRPMDLEIFTTSAGWFLTEESHATLSRGNIHYMKDVVTHRLNVVVILLTALAGFKLLRGRLRPLRRYGDEAGPALFIAIAVTFIILSLGSRYAFLPIYWLKLLIPQTQAFVFTMRLSIGVYLGLAMLGAMALASLLHHHGPKRRGLLCSAAGMLIFMDTLFFSPPFFPLNVRSSHIPAVYDDLRKILNRGAVLEVPYSEVSDALELSPSTSFRMSMEPAFYYQTLHRHPLVHGELDTRTRQMPEFHARLSRVLGIPGPMKTTKSPPHRVPFCYIVLNESLIKEERLGLLRAFLEINFRLLRHYPQERYRLYRASGCRGMAPPTNEEAAAFRTNYPHLGR